MSTVLELTDETTGRATNLVLELVDPETNETALPKMTYECLDPWPAAISGSLDTRWRCCYCRREGTQSELADAPCPEGAKHPKPNPVCLACNGCGCPPGEQVLGPLLHCDGSGRVSEHTRRMQEGVWRCAKPDPHREQMKLSEIPPVFREALCVHALFGAAGVPMSDIYVIPECIDRDTGLPELGVMARQGTRTFTVTVGPLGMPVEEFAEKWSRTIETVRQLSADEHGQWLDDAVIQSRLVAIWLGMRAKGFVTAADANGTLQ